MAGAGEHTIQLGHHVALAFSFPAAADELVRVRLSWRGRQVFGGALTADGPRTGFVIDLRRLRVGGSVAVDFFRGELRLAAHLEVRHPATRAGENRVRRNLLDFDKVVVVRFGPSVGEIAGSPVAHAPVVDDLRFGRSQLCTPVVLRIHVDQQARALADVGRIVKHELFEAYPPFTFNTVACVGAAAAGAPGAYTDPESIWFNVFFGFYQVDCDKARWTRPFGYRSAAGIAAEPVAEDVVRLGKADWNWFSNWMYGVPESVLYPYSPIGLGGVEIVIEGPSAIGASSWHHVRISGVEVASCYQAGGRTAQRLERNTVLQTVWRHAFGLPHPRTGHPVSFVPTKVDAVLDMAYWEDDVAYHTVMFGGTARTGSSRAFLGAQVAATRTIIEETYPALGFT